MSNVPEQLTGSNFEKLLAESAEREERTGHLTMTRYGVKGVTINGGKTLLVPSLPDFEGIVAFPAGRQFIIEAKNNSKVSFEMHPKMIKMTQVQHLLTRSRFGALSFLVIHWNARKLTSKYDPAFTVAIPITDEDPRWQRFVDACAKFKADKKTLKDAAKFNAQPAITRDECHSLGTVVRWVVPKGCRKALPDLLPILDPQGHFQGQPELL